MANLHETIMGERLLKQDIPEIAHQLQKIAKELERANDLKEHELRQRKVEHYGG